MILTSDLPHECAICVCVCVCVSVDGGGGKGTGSDSTPQQASPLRPRRFTLGPTRGGGRKRDHDGLSVHLQWPVGQEILCN